MLDSNCLVVLPCDGLHWFHPTCVFIFCIIYFNTLNFTCFMTDLIIYFVKGVWSSPCALIVFSVLSLDSLHRYYPTLCTISYSIFWLRRFDGLHRFHPTLCIFFFYIQLFWLCRLMDCIGSILPCITFISCIISI